MTNAEATAARREPASVICAAAESTIRQLAKDHPCSNHELFSALESKTLSVTAAGSLLGNYDAHASVLRRLLLKAATIMPEAAVGFILENVRNEYGNGVYRNNHQGQLRDLANCIGVPVSTFNCFAAEPGIREFIKQASRFYFPLRGQSPGGLYKPAIAAGAITATELLAIKEFVFLQKTFSRFGQEHHIWFHHVAIEEEHSGESLALALHFVENHHAYNAVEYGLSGVLDANMHLYDGLLAAIS